MTDTTPTSAGYDDVRNTWRSLRDEPERPEGYDSCCGRCVSGLDPRHTHEDEL